MLTTRITDEQLETLVNTINDQLGTPPQPYVDGLPQAGCYHLARDFGLTMLVRLSVLPGSTTVSNPLEGMYLSRLELFNRLQAFIAGIQAQKQAAP